MGHKAALVTGGAHRLGRAMGETISQQGVAVAVHYSSSKAAADETVASVLAAGGHAVSVHADLLVLEQMETLITRASEALGQPLDILINSASIFEHDAIDTLTSET